MLDAALEAMLNSKMEGVEDFEDDWEANEE